MYSNSNRNPAWYKDIKWLTGLLLVPTLALATLFFSLSQLTNETPAKNTLESVLQLTLLPEGLEADTGLVPVQQGFAYVPGEPLRLLPGVDVYVDATELQAFTVADAKGRIAGVIADRVIADGAADALSLVPEGVLRNQLDEAFESTVPLLMTSLLEASMLPSGLDDGSRLANWQLQAQQNPGELVQPVVGVFIFASPNELSQLSDRAIGELVVRRLAQVVQDEGLAAAQDLITNSNLQSRLTTTVDRDVRATLHEFLQTLLVAQEATIEDRLTKARDVVAQLDQPEETVGLLSISNAEELAGLSPQEANRVVLRDLAAVVYTEGGFAASQLVTDAEQSQRLQRVLPTLNTFTRARHARFVQLTWLAGIIALLLLVVLLFVSTGLNRLLHTGVVIAVSALLGSSVFWPLQQNVANWNVAIPTVNLSSEGALGYLLDLLTYVSIRLPAALFDVLARNHLIVLLSGVSLIVLYILIQLFRLVRPRRRY